MLVRLDTVQSRRIFPIRCARCRPPNRMCAASKPYSRRAFTSLVATARRFAKTEAVGARADQSVTELAGPKKATTTYTLPTETAVKAPAVAPLRISHIIAF